MSKPDLTEKEAALVNNIINKLQIYMDKTQQSLHSLSATLGFEYQPFYRLMKNKKLPTISSVAMITEHLNCSIEELISDKMLIDVKVFNALQEMTKSENIESVRIFIPIEEYIPNLKNEFFLVRTEIIKSLDIDVCRLYSTTTNINSEGVYAVNYQSKTTELNIISTSSKFVIAELNSQEIRIPQEALEPIAKFVKKVLLFKSNNDYLQGFKE